MPVTIRVEDPRSDPACRELLAERLAHSMARYPKESIHVLDLSERAQENVVFWAARVDGSLVGCGALVVTGSSTAEVKSMFVRSAWRGQGISTKILEAIVEEARRRRVALLRLETGGDAAAAISLYRSHGFVECEAFPPYRPDPLSIFMQRRLA